MQRDMKYFMCDCLFKVWIARHIFYHTPRTRVTPDSVEKSCLDEYDLKLEVEIIVF